MWLSFKWSVGSCIEDILFQIVHKDLAGYLDFSRLYPRMSRVSFKNETFWNFEYFLHEFGN